MIIGANLLGSRSGSFDRPIFCSVYRHILHYPLVIEWGRIIQFVKVFLNLVREFAHELSVSKMIISIGNHLVFSIGPDALIDLVAG